MSRSSWKTPNIKLKLEQICLNQIIAGSNKFNKNVSTYERCATITPEMMGSTIAVHNGNRFIKLKLTKDHVGFKLGQFAFTKKRVKKF